MSAEKRVVVGIALLVGIGVLAFGVHLVGVVLAAHGG